MTVVLLEKITARLLAATAVTDIVGDQVNPSLAPQGGSQPYIVIEEVGGSPEETHDDNATLDGTDIQFSCYGKTKKQALQIRSAVRAALSPDAAMVGVKVMHPVTRGIFEQGNDMHNAIIDFTFMHNPST